MTQKHQIQLFESKKVRSIWDEEQEKWYFSIVVAHHTVNSLAEGGAFQAMNGAGRCVGELLLKYDSMEQMNHIIEHMDDYVHIKVHK